MSDDMIRAPIEKRAELADKVQKLQSLIHHLDATLAVFGHDEGKRRSLRVFANGELIKLLSEAERGGATTHAAITAYVMKAKKMDPGNTKLRKRVYWSNAGNG